MSAPQNQRNRLRLLVVRLGAMGDVLHAMPAVAALRARMPDCHIGWVIEPRWAPLLQSDPGVLPRTAAMPLVDVVHTAHARGWARQPFSTRTWAAMLALRHDLREQQYDLAIDLQGAVRSAWIGKASGARLIGEAEPRERPARWFFARRVPTHGVHVIEQAAEVASAAVNIPLCPMLPPLPVSSSAEDRMATRLPQGRPLALLHPGAGWGAKRWPAERYGAVAAALAARGYAVVVNRAPGEEALASEIRVASRGVALDIATDVGELIAMTRRSVLAIGGDTGPMHLACALGKPVIGIYGPTDPLRNGPWGVPFRVLRHPESRRDHARRHQPEPGLLTITADEVLAAADELMQSVGTVQG
ncbi:MAG: Lipopolysaccharide heptosyltransferase [Acidobacteriaceae bacterium]|nr:Lipopolysaccharide heptosyltransferase [Acidobacteriaceae bacterium]